MDGQRLGVRLHPPQLGEHTAELMDELGIPITTPKETNP